MTEHGQLYLLRRRLPHESLSTISPNITKTVNSFMFILINLNKYQTISMLFINPAQVTSAQFGQTVLLLKLKSS